MFNTVYEAILEDFRFYILSNRFEDGTPPFLDIIAVRHGLDTLECLAGKSKQH